MTKSSNLLGLNRRRFLRAGMLSGAAAATAPLVAQTQAVSVATRFVPLFDFDEITIAVLQEGMKSGRFTARSIANGRRKDRADRCTASRFSSKTISPRATRCKPLPARWRWWDPCRPGTLL